MRVLAFVGPSGTGKSYRAQMVAGENNISYIIDDGLLVNGNEVVAGESAKKAPTKIETVKHAIFIDEKERKEMVKAIKKYKPESILILGTSDGMVEKIAKDSDSKNPQSVVDGIAEGIPMKRLGTIEELGYLALFLASDESSYITGQGFVIDGGSTLPETKSVGV